VAAKEQDAQTFLEHLDAIAERLRPKRRPQDAGARECSARELRALALLGKHGRATMTVLARTLDVPLSTATRIVEGLVRKDLVERARSKTDRRIIEVRFGRRGKRIDEYVKRSRQARAAALLETLPASERAALIAGLARVASATLPAKRPVGR
jgi:DNA-binding MarR family transcriptional regulator